jgi:hypothetical protein
MINDFLDWMKEQDLLIQIIGLINPPLIFLLWLVDSGVNKKV